MGENKHMLTETERASLTATFDSIITRDGSDGVREMQQLLRARARKQRPGRPALPKVVPWSIYMVVEDLRESEGISIKTACDRLASCKFHVLSMPARSPITGSVSRLQQWCVIDDDMEHFRPLLRDLNLIALVRD